MRPQLRDLFRYQGFLRRLIYRILKRCSGFRLYDRIYLGHIKRKASSVPPFPPELSIETVNLCNARCTICAHPMMRREKGKMATELVHSLIDQAARGRVARLFLSGFGEPLLDKRLPEFVAYARGRGIEEIGIVTNGSLLTREVATNLINAGITDIVISMDGFTPETYEKVRIGLKFDDVVDNIRELQSIVASEKPQERQRVKTAISCVDLKHNRNERRIAATLLGKYVDRIYFRQAQGWTAGYAAEKSSYSPHFEPNNVPCRYLWDSLSVYVDGRVPVCCLDYEAREPLGDGSQNAIADIWQGERLQFYRRLHLEQRKGELNPCSTCGYFSVWW